MLPFLKRRTPPASGVTIQARQPAEPIEDISDAHLACAADLLKAIKAQDVKGIAQALYDAFTIMESEPHQEGPHTYEAQNIKAVE